MKRSLPLLLLLAGCPDPTNANKLWLAPDGSQAQIRLSESEPHPF